jgi:hypothetical protein
MSERSRQVLLIVAAVGAIATLTFIANLAPSALVVLAASTAFSNWRARRVRRKAAAFWALVWQVRGTDAADRPQMLAEIAPAELRRRIEQIVARDGIEERDGDVERFPFPLGLRRRIARRYWTCWSIAVASLIGAAATVANTPLTVAAICLAVLAGIGAWRASRQEAVLEPIIEITPSRISELRPDGGKRTLLWNRDLELFLNAKAAYGTLRERASNIEIQLDYRRLGISRLLDLVVRYGQFAEVESLPPAS